MHWPHHQFQSCEYYFFMQNKAWLSIGCNKDKYILIKLKYTDFSNKKGQIF